MATAHSPIQRYLEELHGAVAGHDGGAVADYIPELATADPDRLGICVATADGHVYEVGDTRLPFTIQSMSKPFTYGLALEDRGLEAVLAKVGVEPTGDAFNEISLAAGTGRPLNPMINAGAITSTSLVGGDTPEARLERIVGAYSRYAGRALEVDRAVYDSEHATGHRNRAIGHMLRTFDILTEDPEIPLDLYFSQCSVAITCRDLSLMAATLANDGVQPITGAVALRRDLVDQVLSVMTTCGMYDGAGEWVVDVGLPAKSGVAGGIFAVLPGQFGIAVFSPRLDQHGNSVRGVEICRRLSTDLRLHFLHVARASHAAVRSSHRLPELPSTRRRPESELAALAAGGAACRVYAVQGDLLFAGIEVVVREVIAATREADLVVLDLAEVPHLDAPAANTLAALSAELEAQDKKLVLVDCARHAALQDALDQTAPATDTFANLDEALEWCEERVLDADPTVVRAPETVALRDHRLLHGLDDAQFATLEPLLVHRAFARNDTIMRRGEAADEVLLLVAGQVSVTIPHPDHGVRRLQTLTAGMTLGEAAFVTSSVRNADAHGERDGALYALSVDALAALDDEDVALKAILLRNLLRSAYDTFMHLASDLEKF